MKKILTLTLTVLMLLSASLFIACGGGVNPPTSSNNGTAKPPITSDGSSNSSVNSNSSANSSTSTGGTQTPDETRLQISAVKGLIDANQGGVEVTFKGVVIGFDSMGYAHVGDETGVIYVRAKHENLTLGAYVQITGAGYVYKGSADYPEYTRQIKAEGITVERASGAKPNVKEAVTLQNSDLISQTGVVAIDASFHGNLVTITGTVQAGSTKFTYYLVDDYQNKLVGLHHYSKHFENSTDDATNKFNALNGKKITITGVIYRYYTKENIWTFQYVYNNFNYVEVGGDVKPSVCGACGGVITNESEHALLDCGHNACISGNHIVCEVCEEFLCNGADHSHSGGTGEWCDLCGREIVAGSDHSLRACGEHCNGFFETLNHSMCVVCNGYLCDGEDHAHGEVQTISQVKAFIDQNPTGVTVDFKGVVIGEDAQGYIHVADESGAIYVRARGADYDAYVGDYVQIVGSGYVYRGSEAYPEYTRQIGSLNDYDRVEITKLETDPPFVINPVTLTASDLKTTSESADISKSFHGNPVQITGTLSVGADKYSYYLLDEEGNKLVGLHHMSKYFNGSADEYRNSFNALDGQEVTFSGVIYRYYTKENIWTFQYISGADPTTLDESIIDGVRYEISSDGSYAIAKESVYGDFNQVIEISNDFNGLPVKEIAALAVAERNDLLKVIIPSNVTLIDEGAFKECTKLVEVQIAEDSKLTEIRSSAFQWCAKLATINLPDGLAKIGGYVFSGSAISEITLSNSLKRIDGGAFESCENLESVYFSGSVNDWAKIAMGDNYAASPMHYASEIFFNNERLSNKLTLSSAVTSISSWAFCNFDFVTEVVIPSSVTEVGYGAFEGCDNLVKITMPFVEINNYYGYSDKKFENIFGDVPESLVEVNIIGSEEVPAYYFTGCNKIQKISLAETITVIKEHAFYNCASLKAVNLPENLVTIESGAFYGCSSLTEISLPKKLENIGGQAFACTGLTTVKIPFTTKSIGEEAFANSAVKTIYIHSGIESLGYGAFGYDLTTVYFTGVKTWEEFVSKVGYYASSMSGTKTYVSSYTLD